MTPQDMVLNNNKIDALQSELNLLKTQFTERINNLEYKLSELTASEASTDTQLAEPALDEFIPMAANVDINPLIMSEKQTEDEPIVEIKKIVEIKDKVEYEPISPSFIEIMFASFISSLFDWFEPAFNIYKSYKRRGMMGIFILTILGIGLTLAGFGYLMQLLIDQLGSGSKSLLMLGAALGVIALGIVIKKKSSFNEFATAIVALGILLLYSTVYFSGSVYNVIPYVMVVALYLFIALSAHALALWLDTKIVAALGIIGIAVMPMLSNVIVAQPSYYLISLAFVTASSLVIAYRYVGLWLAHLSLAFVLMSLEWVIFLDGAKLSVVFIDLFYLLFFTYVYLSLAYRSEASHQRSLLFLATLIGGNLLFLFQASSVFSDSISIALVLNASTAIFAAYMLFKQKHLQTHSIILVAAIWTLLAVVSLVGNAYWGIAWAIEGLFLLYLGRRYLLPKVVNQGQILTCISLLYCASALAPYFPLPALTSFDGWMLSICITMFLGIWLRLIDDNGTFNELSIKKVKPILMLIESIWLTLLVFSAAYLAIGEWAISLLILGQFALLTRAHKTKQVSIDVFAAILVFVPLLFIVDTIMNTHSYHFAALPLTMKFATVSIFAQLWLFAEFYRRYQPESNKADNAIIKIAEAARIGFYLLMPLFWISAAIRNLEEYALLIMWLPPAIAMFFAVKIKDVFIVWQAKILIAISSVLLILIMGIQFDWINTITLILFITAYCISFLLNKKEESKLYKYAYTIGIFTLGFALPAWVFHFDDNLLLAMITAAVYWSALFYRALIWINTKPIIQLIHLVSGSLICSSWVLMFHNPLFVIVPIIYMIEAIYSKELKDKIFMLQAKILIAVSCALLILIAALSLNWASVIALGLLAFYLFALFLFKKQPENILYKHMCTVGISSLGFILPIALFSFDKDLLLAMIIASIYWSILLNRSLIWTQIKPIALPINIISGLLVLGAWSLMLSSPLYSLIPIIYIASALYQKEQYFKHSIIGKTLGENRDLGLHLIGVITYISLLVTLSEYRFDLLIAPTLAIHGAMVLFIKEQRLINVKFAFALIFIGILKLALLDASNVLLWQKVMLFMGIGIFILGASFWYQKLTKAAQSKPTKQSEEVEIVE